MAPPAGGRGRRLPALDGLRAVAVAAVLAYHADYRWASGGYLGVDLFFVLSGFLVTGLLISERGRSGTISLGRFWTRRIRRLFPAQLALVTVVMVFTALFHRRELYTLRGQAVSTLTGTTNWFLIATENSYFSAIGRPPVLRHMWSLAIEMQFYLVWPLVFLLAAKQLGLSLKSLMSTFLSIAAASAVLLAVLAGSGQDPSTAYYSTFSRLTGLLLGAALALVWRPKNLADAPIAAKGREVDRFGIAALVLVVAFFFLATDTGIGMYRIGFAAFSVLAVVLVAVASHPTARLAGPRGFGHPVLEAIGVRSYGIYLWHWPVFAYTRPGIDLSWGQNSTFVLRLLLTGVLSELCFRFVEQPWHRGEMSLGMVRAWVSEKTDRPALRPAMAGVVGLVVVGSLLAMVVAPVAKDETVENIEAGADLIESRCNTPPPAAPVEAVPTVPPTVPDTQPGQTTTIPAFGTVEQGPNVTAVGDSVMVGAAPGLYERFGQRIFIDAKVARQAAGVADIVTALRQERGLGDVLLVHIGTNGTFTEEQIDDVVTAAQGTPVVFLTVRANRSWIDDVNETLARTVPTEPGAYLADWKRFTLDHGDWFRDDTVHMTTEGIAAYSDFIHDTLTGKNPGERAGG